MEILTNPWFIAIVSSILAGLIAKLVYDRFFKDKSSSKLETTKTSSVNQTNTQSSPFTIIQTDTQASPTTITQNYNLLSSDSTPTESISSITYGEIVEHLEDLPPYQLKQTRENYKGIRVKWLATLFSVDDDIKKGEYKVYANVGHFQTIVFPIDINRYPQLRVMKKGQSFTVKGAISDFGLSYIELDDCQLFFD